MKRLQEEHLQQLLKKKRAAKPSVEPVNRLMRLPNEKHAQFQAHPWMTLNNWKYYVPLNSLFDRLFMRFLIVIIVITPFDLSNRLRSTFAWVRDARMCLCIQYSCHTGAHRPLYSKHIFFQALSYLSRTLNVSPNPHTRARTRQPWNCWYISYGTANISSSYLISIVINNRQWRRRRRQCRRRWRWWRRQRRKNLIKYMKRHNKSIGIQYETFGKTICALSVFDSNHTLHHTPVGWLVAYPSLHILPVQCAVEL